MSDNANETAASINEPTQDAKPAPAAASPTATDPADATNDRATTTTTTTTTKKPATHVRRSYGERLSAFFFDKRG